MDLWCIAGPDGLGEKKIILPMECQLQSLKLLTCDENQKEIPFKGIEENIERAKEISVNTLDNVFDVTQIALLLHQNVQRIQNSSNYLIGSDEQRLFIGPVLQEIGRSTYGKVKANNFIFFNEKPIGSDGKYKPKLDNQIGITPANDDTNDAILFVFKNGSVFVRSGGYIFFEFPFVLVKSNGEYLTISGGAYNQLILKSGVHLVLFVNLGVSVPVLFIRHLKGLQEIGPQDVTLDTKSVDSHREKSEAVDNSFSNKALIIERMIVNDMSHDKYIPRYIFDWIKTKGYELEKGGGKTLLGVGPTSVVRCGTRLSDLKPIAAKIIVSENSKNPPKELLIAKSVDHKNVVKTLDILCIVAELPNKMDRMSSFVMMELGSALNLRQVIEKNGKMSESEAKHVMKQAMEGVIYLHTNHIVHRHIRPNNCLIFANDVIKLCDFSRAMDLSSGAKCPPKGETGLSLKYMPPEFFSPSDVDLFKLDVWMCGCLMYTLLSANLSPFGLIRIEDRNRNCQQLQAFRERQTSGVMNILQSIPDISESAVNLMSQMFTTNPNQRISEQLVLAHEWLK